LAHLKVLASATEAIAKPTQATAASANECRKLDFMVLSLLGASLPRPSVSPTAVMRERIPQSLFAPALTSRQLPKIFAWTPRLDIANPPCIVRPSVFFLGVRP
jgi:hypothetical protein